MTLAPVLGLLLSRPRPVLRPRPRAATVAAFLSEAVCGCAAALELQRIAREVAHAGPVETDAALDAARDTAIMLQEACAARHEPAGLLLGALRELLTDSAAPWALELDRAVCDAARAEGVRVREGDARALLREVLS